MVTMRIWRNLDAKVKLKANDPTVKEIDKFIYLESEINSEGKLTERSIGKYDTTLNSQL
jgi:hypothetical protein